MSCHEILEWWYRSIEVSNDRVRENYERGSSEGKTFENQASAIIDQMYALNPKLTSAEVSAMYSCR